MLDRHLAGVEKDGHDEIGGVTGGGEYPLALGRLVDRAHVTLGAAVYPFTELGLQPDHRDGFDEDSGLLFMEAPAGER